MLKYNTLIKITFNKSLHLSTNPAHYSKEALHHSFTFFNYLQTFQLAGSRLWEYIIWNKNLMLIVGEFNTKTIQAFSWLQSTHTEGRALWSPSPIREMERWSPYVLLTMAIWAQSFLVDQTLRLIFLPLPLTDSEYLGRLV